MQKPLLWKASVTLPKERIPDAAALIELTPPAPQAVLIAEEPFGTHATLEALYEEPPDARFLTEIVGAPVTAEALPDQDWISLSQEGLPPVRAGRFFVYGAHDAGEVPPGVIPIRIEAALAFGTGHHETTALCLEAISRIANTRRPGRVLDIGCGTGVLAIAAAKIWRERVLATDIDPVARDTTRDNARANGVAPLLKAIVASGLTHSAIRERAPFDLILANILASPLTQLAPGMAGAMAPGGVAVLSGLLRWQENLVLSFYRAQGLQTRHILRQGPWSALLLERPQGRG
jgi:ribosomal protein L11 methyltransferase